MREHRRVYILLQYLMAWPRREFFLFSTNIPCLIFSSYIVVVRWFCVFCLVAKLFLYDVFVIRSTLQLPKEITKKKKTEKLYCFSPWNPCAVISLYILWGPILPGMWLIRSVYFFEKLKQYSRSNKIKTHMLISTTLMPVL